jgi:hypothetical protein
VLWWHGGGRVHFAGDQRAGTAWSRQHCRRRPAAAAAADPPHLPPAGAAPSAEQSAALEALLAAAKPSRFGLGQETRFDPAVRTASELAPGCFHAITGTGDPLPTDAVLHEVSRLLAPAAAAGPQGRLVPAPLSAELYKLNVYGPGGFFMGHVDTPRPGLLGTLVLCLPWPHEGGALALKRPGRASRRRAAAGGGAPAVEFRFDRGLLAAAGGGGPPPLQWAAFFGEVRSRRLLPLADRLHGLVALVAVPCLRLPSMQACAAAVQTSTERDSAPQSLLVVGSRALASANAPNLAPPPQSPTWSACAPLAPETLPLPLPAPPQVEHEVKPVTRGHRLTLTYNLYAGGGAGGQAAGALDMRALAASAPAAGLARRLRALLEGRPPGTKLGVVGSHKCAGGCAWADQ